MKILTIILVAMLDVIPSGKTYVTPLQQRDSILIADQLEYGFRMDSVKTGTMLSLPDFSSISNDTLTVVRNWKIDTLKVRGKRRNPSSMMYDIKVSMILAPFEEGIYGLPSIPVRKDLNGRVDTLLFDGSEIDVKTMPVDTATFVIHDLKGQIRYPLTFAEVAPWVVLFWLVAVLMIAAVCIYKIRSSREGLAGKPQEPAYIVALRELDKYRGDKYWSADKQKQFYSGITDTLKTYMDVRFGVDAPEMTTAELFNALKGDKGITPELFEELRVMFETADFVKFAKFTAPDEDNAKVLPLAVRFVTSTYQTELEEEQKEEHDS